MAKKTSKPAAKKPAAEPGTLAKAKTAVVHAAEKVAAVAVHVAEAAQDHVVTPVAEAVGLAKKKPSPKKARVRPERVKTPPAAAVPLPARSRTAAGKMMSKNLSVPPQEGPSRGTKPKPKGKL